MTARPAVWLDCDPGHDDAIALLLALFAPAAGAASSSSQQSALEVLGVSSVHGNSSGTRTYINAVRLLSAYKIEASSHKVWRGADVPLLRQPKADVAIHGEDGLGGVECLPDFNIADDFIHGHITSSRKQIEADNTSDKQKIPSASPLSLVSHLLKLLQSRLNNGSPPISLIATGPLTNIALLIKMCPGENLELLLQTIEKIVIMGGAAGVPGNRSPLAEWNILVDPEAAAIVFDSPLPVVMAGLDVTHQNIFTPQLHRRLLHSGNDGQTIEELHQKASPIRRLISSAMTFFASTYESEFGFDHGPPVHDMLAVAYVLDPTLFYSKGMQGLHEPSKRYAVKVDTSKGLADGATIVDFYNQWNISSDSWQAGGRNVLVLEHVYTDRLWSLFFQAVDCAEAHVSSRTSTS